MIHRDEHSEGFTLISDELLRNNTLSDGALRLLVYMLSMSDDWSFSVRSLASYFGVTKDTITARVMELKAAGYLTTRRIKNERGQYTASIWDIYEKPLDVLGVPCPTFTRHGKNQTRKTPDTVPAGHGKSRTIKNTNIKEDQVYKNTKEEEEKTAHGEFKNVFLTPEELNKLKTKLGHETAITYVNNLGDYLKEHPRKHYASHYRTILNWYERDHKASKPENVVDWDELMKKAEEADRKKAGGAT